MNFYFLLHRKFAANAIFIFCILFARGASAAETKWVTDLPQALKQAAAEKKAVLVDFTGSDWCVWCKRLRREVFNEPEFREFADKNLVLVEIDFPRYTAQPDELRKTNEALSTKLGIEGFPTILILDASGKQLAKDGYRPGGAEAYVEYLAGISGFQWHKIKKTGSNNSLSPEKAPPAEIRYDELTLREISGQKLKTALINSQTFSEGSSGGVKVGDKRVFLECREIRENSVIVQVEGEKEPRELKLKSAAK